MLVFWRWFPSVASGLCLVAGLAGPAAAQELGGAGTLQGVVKDPTGGVMVAVDVSLGNAVTGFKRATATDGQGRFVFRNLPQNTYHLEVSAQGFQTLARDVEVHSAVPISLDLSLQLEIATQTVEVIGHQNELLERDPTAHTNIGQAVMARLPTEPAAGLNQIITLASPGVVADANGFFHPIGDHAQTQFSIDNQPITDQQSRIYSNQISSDAIQSMEMITGVPPAEFGDKDSLVVRIVTKSGLDNPKPTGSLEAGYGSFNSPTIDLTLGAGSHTFGNFLSFSGTRTDRYLDPPEFEALHDAGSSQSLFDRVDFHPGDVNSLHLDVHLARSSFDVPDTYDQAAAGQSQHQKIDSLNLAPGYIRVIGTAALLSASAYVRQDHVIYTPSGDPFSDQPGTVSQDRTLTNVGGKVDIAYSRGRHNLKAGVSVAATRLNENFTLGVTDATVNSPCLAADGVAVGDPGLVSDAQCGPAGFERNPDYVPGLAPFDLTRGGSPFRFAGRATINGQAIYVQDEIKAGPATFKLGLRGDRYDGLSRKSLAEPRLGVAYSIAATGTILRASYGRTLETPYNENLVLTSSASAAVFGTGGRPLEPGVRDQVEAGVQQALGNWVVVDAGYFDKHTTNGYDFGNLFDTPIFFPVSWDHSRINGLTARINLVEHHGFSAFTVIGHTNAIFYPPGTGGLLTEQPTAPFRIDHDQAFQQTTNVQYVIDARRGAWAALSWRYDSGLVAGSVPDYATALTLTADEQAAIGLYCGSTFAALGAPITSCDSTDRGALRLAIPPDGTEDPVHDPARIAPRHLFDIGIGADNLLAGDRVRLRVRVSVINATDTVALYNFLSTFSGTHFVTPRTYQLQVGVSF
jgi:hypothetical protein